MEKLFRKFRYYLSPYERKERCIESYVINCPYEEYTGSFDGKPMKDDRNCFHCSRNQLFEPISKPYCRAMDIGLIRYPTDYISLIDKPIPKRGRKFYAKFVDMPFRKDWERGWVVTGVSFQDYPKMSYTSFQLHRMGRYGSSISKHFSYTLTVYQFI